MIQEIELNGVKVKVEITKEMARKVLEESEEIKFGENYYFTDTEGEIENDIWKNHSTDFYRRDQDNCLPCKSYTEQQAKEYFDKRDARRTAEYRIKKAIEKMNGGKERDCCISYERSSSKFDYRLTKGSFSVPIHMQFNSTLIDYMLEHHTEDYKIYLGIE